LWFRCLWALLAGSLWAGFLQAEGLAASRLGVIYSLDDPSSRQVASYYAIQRRIPSENLIGIHIPNTDVITPETFAPLRKQVLDRLPVPVQSLALIWSAPYAVGCMSVTTAFAAGYRPAFCIPGCSRTALNPLFNAEGWLPADTVGWWPAMLLPSADVGLAHALIERGIAAEASSPPGTLYLVRTQDRARSVRAATYPEAELLLAHRLSVVDLSTPIARDVSGAIGYFTGASQVEELPRIHFRPGAIADHLTSYGGVLPGRGQMSAISWIRQGATGSFGSVSEPCALVGKFPDVRVLFSHYLRGETLLEAYWKSVAMPGQGLFIGEPLSRPFAARD
jgi:uncharacterized protein (TIGR03790 family)